MIIQIGTEVDESRILWKYKESDEWKRADIDDLIYAYEVHEDRSKGEWIPKKFPYAWYYPACSVCGFENEGELNNYCPNCGALMMDGDTE